MADHPSGAICDVDLVGSWSVRAQNREQSVFPRLREVEPLGLLLGRDGRICDLLQFSQTPRCRLVARVLALLSLAASARRADDK